MNDLREGQKVTFEEEQDARGRTSAVNLKSAS
jgi:cold shock CspA family protein